MVTSKKTESKSLTFFIKPMNSITRFSAISLPAVIGVGIAWLGNRIIKNEKGLKERELELKLHLNNKFH